MFGVSKLHDGDYEIKYPNKRGDRTLKLIVGTIEQCHEAMNHHFQTGPRAAQHSRNEIEHCPLCFEAVEQKLNLKVVG